VYQKLQRKKTKEKDDNYRRKNNLISQRKDQKIDNIINLRKKMKETDGTILMFFAEKFIKYHIIYCLFGCG
jgi:hypothetical protein